MSEPQVRYQTKMHSLQKELMLKWYQDLNNLYKENKGAVYLMISGNPVELIRAFDLLPVYPEINALQLAIRKQSLQFLQEAENIGYSMDNCGYVKADIGAFLSGYLTSLGTHLPKPLLILCNFVGCNTYIKWFEHLAHFTHSPLYVLDIPFMRESECKEYDVQYVIEQLKGIIKFLEERTGKRFDIDKFKQILTFSAEMEELWTEVKEMAKNVPTPFDAYFDSTTLMGPLYVYRGTKEGVDYFKAVVEELKTKVKEGKGAVEKERFRMVVEGPPPYPYFKKLRDMLSSWGAVSVASTYSTVGGIWEFGFRHNPKQPLESLALHMISHNLPNRNYLQRYDQINRYIKEWKADALFIHFVKSCRLFSCGQGDMRELFIHKNIPTLYIESDLEDPRYFAEAQVKNRIDAFFEALEVRKFGKK